MRRFFISSVQCTSANNALEKKLCANLNQYTDCIMSEDALRLLVNQTRKEREELLEKNKRLSGGEVNFDLSLGSYLSPRFNIGTAYVSIREIKREYKTVED